MTQVGSVYGEALYDLARSENLDEAILNELDVLVQSFDAEPDFIKLLGTPLHKHIWRVGEVGISRDC